MVHRDVTPSNLILCYNGAVKIVDFGIAKAIDSAEEGSDASAIKGKLSYLAPEQIRNRGLDARTDVFQLGIVLHEMLCGRRLFNARSNHQKILAVLNRDIPRPSAYNPDVPEFVDDIVLHALQRAPEKRIQSADELRERLEGALEKMSQPVSDAQLGAWLRNTFPAAHKERLDIERMAIKAARSAPKVIDTAQPSSRDQAPAGSRRQLDTSRESASDMTDRSFGARTATSTSTAAARASVNRCQVISKSVLVKSSRYGRCLGLDRERRCTRVVQHTVSRQRTLDTRRGYACQLRRPGPAGD